VHWDACVVEHRDQGSTGVLDESQSHDTIRRLHVRGSEFARWNRGAADDGAHAAGYDGTDAAGDDCADTHRYACTYSAVADDRARQRSADTAKPDDDAHYCSNGSMCAGRQWHGDDADNARNRDGDIKQQHGHTEDSDAEFGHVA